MCSTPLVIREACFQLATVNLVAGVINSRGTLTKRPADRFVPLPSVDVIHSSLTRVRAEHCKMAAGHLGRASWFLGLILHAVSCTNISEHPSLLLLHKYVFLFFLKTQTCRSCKRLTLQKDCRCSLHHTSADAVYCSYSPNNFMDLQTQLAVCISWLRKCHQDFVNTWGTYGS